MCTIFTVRVPWVGITPYMSRVRIRERIARKTRASVLRHCRNMFEVVLRKASEARVNRRLRRYYPIVLLLPNIFTLPCLLLSSI